MYVMLQCQRGQLTRQHLYFSLLLHLALLVVFILSTFLGNRKKTFVVFGVHSSKATPVYFKPLKNIKLGKSCNAAYSKPINKTIPELKKKYPQIKETSFPD